MIETQMPPVFMVFDSIFFVFRNNIILGGILIFMRFLLFCLMLEYKKLGYSNQASSLFYVLKLMAVMVLVEDVKSGNKFRLNLGGIGYRRHCGSGGLW